ncbi:patatin-like phospholipase family protein [Amnibacterium endophyticum]|uniref:Patatin-like phospholipase family protein n=1 Tax=Amnibacterium endophyticum TaxID=2109337 RepID=A0ABW4LC68_9MICO
MDGGRALVLGGGGVAGIAWETGMLVGLAEAGVDLGSADRVIGTSAGSVAGALLRSGASAAAWQAAISEDEPVESSALGASPDTDRFMQAAAEALASPAASPEEARSRLGALARRVSADGQAERVAVFAGLIGGTEWPEGDLRVTAVDAEDGAFRVFDRGSGVPLAAAVAASCAVPVVYPTVEIDGRRWMDGGMRSATNADLARGAERVVVLACGPEIPGNPLGPGLEDAVAELRRDAEVVVVLPDAASAAAFGTNSLAQASRRPAALAGRAQAASVAERVRAVWG